MANTRSQNIGMLRTLLAPRIGRGAHFQDETYGGPIPVGPDEVLVGTPEIQWGARVWQTRRVSQLAEVLEERQAGGRPTHALLREHLSDDALLLETLAAAEHDGPPTLADSELLALRDAIPDWTLSDHEIADALNAPGEAPADTTAPLADGPMVRSAARQRDDDAPLLPSLAETRLGRHLSAAEVAQARARREAPGTEVAG